MKEDFPIDLLPLLIGDYVRMCSDFTEAPEEYHTACGLFISSYLIGNWISVSSIKLNDYYLIVGDTGVSKKSTAMRLAVEMCRESLKHRPDLSHKLSKIDTKTGKKVITYESPYELLTHFSVEGLQTRGIGSGKSTGIRVGEYRSVFEINVRKGQGNTIPELTDMYDSGFIKTALLGREVNSDNYLLSIIASSTPSWLKGLTQGENIAGGFTNRHACFVGTPTRTIPFPVEIPPERFSQLAQRFSKLIPEKIQINGVEDENIHWTAPSRVLSLTNLCQRAWVCYYSKRTEDMRSIPGSLISDLGARELTHAMKFAGLAACIEGKQTIEKTQLEFGVRLARWCIRNLADLTLKTKDAHLDSPQAKKVWTLINKKGPMTKQAIARSIGGKQESINIAIEHLKIDKILNEYDDGRIGIDSSTPNQVKDEIEHFLGKSNISEIFEKIELEVGAEKSRMADGETNV